MNRIDQARQFISALDRQISRKSQMKDGINHDFDNFRLIAYIAEELGEASSDLVRERYYGVVAECVDIAHSALLLAINIDSNGSIIDNLFKDSSNG